jgi:hypothetical protein
MKTFKAMIWEGNPEKPGRRVTVIAKDLDDAKRQLETKYGEGLVFDLHNEQDAAKPR